MNRRHFLRVAAIGATAVTVTSVSGGWSLARLRAWLGQLFAPEPTSQIHTISQLSDLYRRATTKLYRTYTRRVPEYSWMDDIDAKLTASGREVTIPLQTA